MSCETKNASGEDKAEVFINFPISSTWVVARGSTLRPAKTPALHFLTRPER